MRLHDGDKMDHPMMTRFAFLFAGFFGATAIKAQVPSPPPQNSDCATRWKWLKDNYPRQVRQGAHPIDCYSEPVPANICPVCQTAHEPWKMGPPNCLGMNGPMPCPTAGGSEPGTRLVRCKNCNAAFWQDAEDKKP